MPDPNGQNGEARIDRIERAIESLTKDVHVLTGDVQALTGSHRTIAGDFAALAESHFRLMDAHKDEYKELLRTQVILKETVDTQLEGAKLSDQRMDRFEKAWYQAARGTPPKGDAYETWRRIKVEQGERDIERFIVDWTELRIVLELAAANQLAVGLLFYE